MYLIRDRQTTVRQRDRDRETHRHRDRGSHRDGE